MIHPKLLKDNPKRAGFISRKYWSTHRRPPLERFMEKVIKMPNGCWHFKHTPPTGHYPSFRIGGKSITAHRASYTLFKGTIEDGKCICHTCDNKSCLNPDHLYKGTYYDNTLDAIKRLRRKAIYSSPLTEELVKQMRAIHSQGKNTIKTIANNFGISTVSARHAITRRTWNWVV